MKQISMNDSIFKLASENPEIVELMVQLGFSDIAKPGMLNTVGRVMTLRKGAKMKNIDLKLIRVTFKAAGFELDEEV